MKRYTSLRDRLLASSYALSLKLFGIVRVGPSVLFDLGPPPKLTNGKPCRIMVKGWRNDRGYVKLSFRDRSGRSVSVWAHRAAYVALKGKRLRKGHPIDHECQRRDCIEPAHLTLTTHRRNGQLVHTRKREFCVYCGAGIGKHRRAGEGTCPKCDPPSGAQLRQTARELGARGGAYGG